MKKYGNILLCLMLIFQTGFAQKKGQEIQVPQMPIDKTTKLITYTGTIETKGTKAEIYKRALDWYHSFYKNPRDVIRKKDDGAGTIDGIARFRIFDVDKKGFKTQAGSVAYGISVFAQNDKYEYVITKINWKQISHYPIEKWMDKSSGYYTKKYDYYLLQTDEFMKELIENLISKID